MFNKNLLNKIDKLTNTAYIKAGGSNINLSEGGVLHNDLSYLLLPKLGYYYDKDALANLLSLACVVNEYWVRMNTRIDDVIYVQSKTGRRLLRFQQCRDQNLYYLDLENPDMDEACLFTPIDKKRA